MSDIGERVIRLLDKLAAKKVNEDAVKTEYNEKAKTKALTTAERLDRLEKLAGIK